MQRISLLSGVAAVAVITSVCGPAAAADLPAKGRAVAAVPAPVVAAPISFAGFYIGGHLGYGTSKFHGFTSSHDFAEFVKPKGFLLGLQAGYNWQVNQVVFGLEGDITWTPWSKKTALSCAGCESGQMGQLRGLASIRGRLGWAIDRSLIYATGGVAWARKKSAANSSDITHPETNTKSGWVAGGGLEYKLTQNVSWRVEGLYYRFNEDRRDPITSGDAGISGIKNATVGRVGVNWYF